jgi:hypothetical protein
VHCKALLEQFEKEYQVKPTIVEKAMQRAVACNQKEVDRIPTNQSNENTVEESVNKNGNKLVVVKWEEVTRLDLIQYDLNDKEFISGRLDSSDVLVSSDEIFKILFKQN